MITSSNDLNLKDLSLAPRKWLVATFVLQLVVLVVVSLHLFAAWQYKAKWIDLQKRVEKLESLSVAPLETTKPKQ